MAKYRFLYALLFIGAIVFALAYESRLSLILLAGTALLPLCTFLLLMLTGALLKLEVTPDTAYVGKLQSFDITVRVINRFIIPVSPMMITGTFHDSDGNVISGRKLVLSASALRKSDYVFKGSIRYRGEYILGIESAEIYDLLRIFRFRIKNTPGCRVTVTPRRIILDETNALCSDDYDSNVTRISFFDSGSFASVREYAEGDLLKHVHWKLSAKHDELMVKQMEQNLGSSAVIITDMRAVSDSDDTNMRSADASAEASLAITRKIISDGRSAMNFFRTGNDSADAVTAEKPEDYEKLVAIFAVIPITDEKKSCAELVSAAASFFTGNEPLFIVTPRLEPDELADIIRLIGQTCGEIRIYLTSAKPDERLISQTYAARNASVYHIDPDSIALSLRNSMQNR